MGGIKNLKPLCVGLAALTVHCVLWTGPHGGIHHGMVHSLGGVQL